MSGSLPKLTAMMLVRNEADRYLTEVLSELSKFVDEIIILDDGSTDHTPDLCLSFPKVRLYRETGILDGKGRKHCKDPIMGLYRQPWSGMDLGHRCR